VFCIHPGSIDYVAGVADIERQVIRTIGDPDERFQQDPVRMIRVIRHAARTGFSIEDQPTEPSSGIGKRYGNVPLLAFARDEHDLLTVRRDAERRSRPADSGELALLTHPRYLGHMLFNGTLARMPMGAETPREVLEKVRDADWSPDGSDLAVIRESGDGTASSTPSERSCSSREGT
jgi:hypothetical protein